MARILFVAPPLAGHMNQLLVLARALSSSGHSISVATGKAAQKRVQNHGLQYEEWDLDNTDAPLALRQKFKSLWRDISSIDNPLLEEKVIYTVVSEMYRPMYWALNSVFDKVAPELVVTDSSAFAALDLGCQKQLPTVVLAQFLGNLVPTPASLPRYGTSLLRRMTLRERFTNWMHPIRQLYYLGGPFSAIERQRRSCALHFSLGEAFRRALILVSTAFGVELPRPIPPHIRLVGPILPAESAPLNADIKEWLEDGADSRPTVYVSFGTLAWPSLEMVSAIVESMDGLPLKVLWTMPQEQQALLPQVPNNFKLKNEVDQQAVLSHGNVKLFVSHCGMNSVSESLFFGKPILGIPVFGDQHYNAARIVDLQVGLRLPRNLLSSGTLRSSIKTMIADASFENRARHLSRVQQACRGRELALQNIEDVLAMGYHHLLG